MEKNYDPTKLEKTIYENWESQNYFAPHHNGPAYSIVLPPPNVTGILHMGHGFQHTLMDALTRYHRMCGNNTLWQPGVDHAGIATQMVVERQLAAEGETRHTLGREKFVDRIWQWKEKSGGTISQQMRRLGVSVDWTRERFTMDEGLSKAVKKAFIDLYDEGLIYRGKRLVNWDPVLHTAISNLEVVNEEEKGFFWTIRYPIVDSNEFVLIATTRPETMLGDTAIAVHPDDERYQSLVGKEVKLPLTERTIPIIADEYVDPEFGTGCVKITPAHDFNDYAVGKRHDLPIINILDQSACLNENTPKKYQGLDRFDARKKIVEDLKSENLLEKIEPHTLKVPRGDRSKTIIEPWLTDQWFVKIAPLAKPAIDAVQSGKINFIPDGWKNTYFQWMNNIEDWCISRQLWWGHRIPAWFDVDGNIYVGHDEANVREKYQLGDITLTQDNDVLDTWFSSALWPFSTLGWPAKTRELNAFYPTNVLVTGFDIIFFWVARMIMFGLKFMDDVPFREIYITGLIRDHQGNKMSKSKGNVLDPIDLVDGIDLQSLIEKRTQGLMQPEMKETVKENTQKEFPNGIKGYGTDALRMTFCALASTSRDICFDVQRLEGYRNFCNKLWNATRYVLMNTEGTDLTADKQLSIADRWILSKLQKTIKQVHEHFATYRFDLLIQVLHDFVWNEFCSWYLELSKPVLTDDTVSTAEKRGTRHTLLHVLEEILKLLQPIIPFVTEYLWHEITQSDDTLMLQTYPAKDETKLDETAEQDIDWIKTIIMAIRNVRSEINISPNKKINLILQNGTSQDHQNFETYRTFLSNLAKLDKIDWIDNNETVSDAATTLADQLKIHIPLEGLVDVGAEKARVKKEIEKLKAELKGINARLSNENFAKRAPADVVEKTQARAKEIEHTIAVLASKL